jgi:hypothetical protein
MPIGPPPDHGARIHEVTLSYPGFWQATPCLVTSDEPEREMRAWLDRHDLMTAPEERAKVAATRNGLCVTECFPYADVSRLGALARFLSLWFIYEDRTEQHGVSPAELAIGRILADNMRHKVPQLPDAGAWAEIGHLLQDEMTSGWLDRFGRIFTAWQFSVDDEIKLVRRNNGQSSRLDEYLSVRLHSIGLYVLASMIEYAYGRELPPATAWDPYFAEVFHVLIPAIAIVQNDLYGITKDAQAGWHNSALCLAQEQSIPVAMACDVLARRHDSLIGRLLLAEQHLLAKSEGELRWWTDAVHDLLTGLAAWTAIAPRYQSEHHVRDDTVVRIVSRRVGTDNWPGLYGASA